MLPDEAVFARILIVTAETNTSLTMLTNFTKTWCLPEYEEQNHQNQVDNNRTINQISLFYKFHSESCSQSKVATSRGKGLFSSEFYFSKIEFLITY